MIVYVDVVFRGKVCVNVPDHLDAQKQKELAKNVVLCRVLATLDNDDCPADDACNEYIENGGSEDDWDYVFDECGDISGCWSLDN